MCKRDNEGPEKEGLIFTIANNMKKSYLSWNRDTVDDKVIFGHLSELSGGKINIDPTDEDLSEASELLRSNKKYAAKKPAKKSNRPRGRKRY